MVKEIFDYFSSTKSKIAKVHLVIFMEDTYQSFQAEMAQYKTTSGRATGKKGKVRRSIFSEAESFPAEKTKVFTIKDISVRISRGDITESSCDVIVNPTDSKITLTGQGVAGAILSKGGSELQQLCYVLTSNGKVLDDSTLVLETKATGQLMSKRVFHICFQSNDSRLFERVITACLQKAESERLKSIAFPAIGTGIRKYPERQAALGMLNAIRQFSSKAPRPAHLHNIDIVLFQPATCESFVQVFQNPSSTETGLLHRAKQFFGFADAIESEVVAVPDSTELRVEIYGETNHAVKEAEKKFYALVDEFFISDFVYSDSINNLTQKDQQELVQVSKSKQVEITIECEPLNRIGLKGNTSTVQEMKYIVQEKLSQIERKASIQREAEQLCQTIQWKRMDSDETAYDPMTNYEIEDAHKSLRVYYIQGKRGSEVHFTIDFKKMVEKDHSTQNEFKIVRVNVLEELKKGKIPKLLAFTLMHVFSNVSVFPHRRYSCILGQ